MIGRFSPFLLFIFLSTNLSAQTPSPDLDQVELTNGRVLGGLVLEETPSQIRFRVVSRKSGRPTLTSTETFSRTDIRSVKRLSDPARESLVRKLADLDRQRELFLANLRQLDRPADKKLIIDGIRPTAVAWEDDPNQTAWAFDSQFFILTTNLREPLAVLVTLQLEEIFRAISNLIPPKIPGRPTRIRIWADQAGYLRAVARDQPNLEHPAFYDPLTNRILAGTDLARIESEAADLRIHHAKQLGILTQRESEIQKAMGGRIPPDFADIATRSRREIRDADQKNIQAVRQSRTRLLQILNHEAIHAYLGNWVYDRQNRPLPRWLNEGMAQVFETGLIEAGEIRADWPDPARLSGVRQLIRDGRFPPLRKILADSPDHFLVRNDSTSNNPETDPYGQSEREASREAYLASWILAYHLTFGLKKIPGPEFDQYIESLAKAKGKAENFAAFEAWTKMDMDTFEKGMMDFIGKLRPDGSLAPKK